MTVPWPGRDEGEVEAIVVDRYLDSLLTRRPADVAGIDDDLRATAIRLIHDLPRYHPSFVFAERLADRLTALAGGLDAPARGAVVIPLPTATADVDGPAVHPAATRPGARPVVIGGVLTSAAISLAGAAFVAWRLRRPAGDPMSRAIRAVARTRIA